MDDGEFLFWSNDGESNSFSTTDVPTGIDQRLTREWVIEETGEVGSVDISFDLAGITLPVTVNTASHFFLLTDGDGTFASGSSTLEASSLSNDVVTFTGINEDLLDDGVFFTLGVIVPPFSPGGIDSDIQLWLKADTGTSTSTDGNLLSAWSDQSGQGRNATQSSSSQRPRFLNNTSDNFNFNPTIDFDGTSDHLELSLDALEGTDEFTYFSVGIRTDDSNNPIVGSDQDSDDFYFGYISDSTAIFAIDTRTPFEFFPSVSIPAHDDPAISPFLLTGYTDTVQQDRDGFLSRGAGSTRSMGNGARYYIGRGDNEAQYFHGRFGEIIIYDSILGTTDRSKVKSYLAIKYGLTIGQNIAAQDYLSSAGTVIWDASTVGTSYDEDIAAIGQDDASELNQTQSKSVNSDAIVTIAENGGGMEDGEFLFWSNDGGSYSFITTDVPTGIEQRLTREWVIEETGEVGSVDISFDLNGITLPFGVSVFSEIFLLTDDDGTFASGSSTLQASSLSNDVLTFTGIDEDLLDDGVFFTLGVIVPWVSPGGIDSRSQLWLKADTGTSTSTDGVVLSTWSDQSDHGNNATQSSSSQRPRFRNNTSDNFNFNPTIDFDGTNDHLDLSLDALEGTDEFTYFSVGIRTDDSNNPIVGSDQDSDDFYFGYISDSTAIFAIDTRTPFEFFPSVSIPAHDDPAISPFLLTGYTDTVQQDRDGFLSRGAGSTRSMGNGARYYIGRGDNEAQYFHGRFGEIIIYDSILGTTDRSKVKSYLAIKYGLTIGQNIAAQDYLSSAGTVIWDASTVGTSYDEDIAAIGQDDASGLNQTQSKSVNSRAIVTIAENGGGMTDGEFLFWSNNGGSTTLNTTDLPSGISYRLPREWVIEETGEVGSVDISFDLDGITLPSGVSAASHFFLLTDIDGTFASGAGSLVASSFSNNVVTFTGIGENQLEDEVFFTLGATGNGNPDAVDDSVMRIPGTDLVKIFIQDLLDNDSDPNGDSFSFVDDQLPATSANGSTLSVLTGSRWILYTPAESEPATDDTFTYQIQDTHGATDTATVTLTTETPNTQTRNNTRAAVNGNDIDVEFRGIPGRKYKVQYTTNLEGTISWTDTGVTITAGSRGKLSHTDANGAAQHGSKFFRTVEVDE